MTDSIIGGVLIGCSAVWLYLSLGRIAGISGIAHQLLNTPSFSRWPIWFILGLGGGGWLVKFLVEPAISSSLSHPALLILGGVLVGVGTRMGSGCTSGHGVCGMSRFSPRSFAATTVFLSVGIIVATGVGTL